MRSTTCASLEGERTLLPSVDMVAVMLKLELGMEETIWLLFYNSVRIVAVLVIYLMFYYDI